MSWSNDIGNAGAFPLGAAYPASPVVVPLAQPGALTAASRDGMCQ